MNYKVTVTDRVGVELVNLSLYHLTVLTVNFGIVMFFK